MAGKCIIPGCKTTKTTKGITFHKLPLDKPELLEQWLQVIKKKNWSPNRNDLICSQHFSKDAFIYKKGRAYLKNFSVPNVISSKAERKPAFKIKLVDSDQPTSRRVSQLVSQAENKSKQKIDDVENGSPNSVSKKSKANGRKKTKTDFLDEAEPPLKKTKWLPLLTPTIVVERLNDLSLEMLKHSSPALNKPEEAVKMHDKIKELESENCSLQKVVYQEQVRNKTLQQKLSKLVAESKYSVNLKTPKLVIAHVKL